MTDTALDEGMAAAKAEGWGLRQIGGQVGLSHEKARYRLTRLTRLTRHAGKGEPAGGPVVLCGESGEGLSAEVRELVDRLLRLKRRRACRGDRPPRGRGMMTAVKSLPVAMPPGARAGCRVKRLCGHHHPAGTCQSRRMLAVPGAFVCRLRREAATREIQQAACGQIAVVHG
ncbi:hypothetical protein RMT89_20780 [Streptomyces sp. P17]|nr:hypothetical protein [Streptomyces sp. P17]